MKLLARFRQKLRSGTHPEVARAWVRHRLLEKRKHPGTVARHVDRITEILERTEKEIREEPRNEPEPAA